MFGSPKMLIWMTLGAALVAGALIALITGSWWTLLIPVVLHGVATTLVLTGVFNVLGERDKPDPVTQAHLDEREQPPATS
jgi:membrane protein implicated in regulation of membrane protease activity